MARRVSVAVARSLLSPTINMGLFTSLIYIEDRFQSGVYAQVVVYGLRQERIGVRMLQKNGGAGFRVCVSARSPCPQRPKPCFGEMHVFAQTRKPSLAVKPRIVASGCEFPLFRKLSEAGNDFNFSHCGPTIPLKESTFR
jgi:hypothetical protein